MPVFAMRERIFGVAALLASAIGIVAIGQFTNVDLALADAMFNHAENAFPFRHAWIAEQFSHVWMKYLLTAFGLGAVGLCIADLFKPMHNRRAWRTVALSAVLVPLAISGLKQVSASHCPWELERYGGEHPYIRLLDAVPADVPAGHCLPAGHASSALWLVSLCVFWLPARPRTATAVGIAMLALGASLGWMQQLRGAHFLSHTLWSMWIACAIVWSLLNVAPTGYFRAPLAKHRGPLL
jgi:membrane-associated PAP2 superfamily phosphatase